MQIKNLSLQNFRNYENEKFTFSEGLNVLFGKNAQGKTNCAEAVFYLCTGTSLRIRHDKQLIRIGEPCAKISAEAENRYGSVTIEADIFEDKRELRVNGGKITKNAVRQRRTDIPGKISAQRRLSANGRQTTAELKRFRRLPGKSGKSFCVELTLQTWEKQRKMLCIFRDDGSRLTGG